MRMKDQVVIVTGGANGIGKATCERFAQEGAKVLAADIDDQGLNALKETIEKNKGICSVYRVDVTNKTMVEKMVEKAKEEWGRVDVLINNAGITRDDLLIRMKEESWDLTVAVNLKGVFLCGQAVASVMIRQRSGRIINVASIAGIYGNAGQTNYAATKAGVIGITKTWAKELGGKGITCNAVAPGFIQTEMTAHLKEEVIKMGMERTPLKRMGTADDVANCFLFLASSEASYITGQVIGIDGGLTL